MARCRSIKPGFMTNEALPELGMEAHLLYPMLWMIADKSGRLEDRPKRIKLECMPAYDVDIEDLLEKLAGGEDPFILRYSVAGKRYIQIVKWKGNQSPHHTEKESVIPEPPLDHRDLTVTSPPTSLLDATSNQLPVTSKSCDGGSGGKAPAPKADPFDAWWKLVPNKVGKDAAQKAYAKAAARVRGRPPDKGPGGEDPHGYLADRMALFSRSPKATHGFCPHPSKWLNEGRYDDDPILWNDTGSRDSRQRVGTGQRHPGDQAARAAARPSPGRFAPGAEAGGLFPNNGAIGSTQ